MPTPVLDVRNLTSKPWRFLEPPSADNMAEVSRSWSWLHVEPETVTKLPGLPIELSEASVLQTQVPRNVSAPLPLDLSTQEAMGLFPHPAITFLIPEAHTL